MTAYLADVIYENLAKESSSTAIIGGADGPTSIFLAGDPIKAIIIPLVIFAVIVFAGGFAIGYFVRGKSIASSRRKRE